MIPSVVTLRMMLSPVSAMKTLPDLSTATPEGRWSRRLGGGSAVVEAAGAAAETGRAGSREGVDDAVSGDDADAIVLRIGDVEVAGAHRARAPAARSAARSRRVRHRPSIRRANCPQPESVRRCLRGGTRNSTR